MSKSKKILVSFLILLVLLFCHAPNVVDAFENRPLTINPAWIVDTIRAYPNEPFDYSALPYSGDRTSFYSTFLLNHMFERGGSSYFDFVFNLHKTYSAITWFTGFSAGFDFNFTVDPQYDYDISIYYLGSDVYMQNISTWSSIISLSVDSSLVSGEPVLLLSEHRSAGSASTFLLRPSFRDQLIFSARYSSIQNTDGFYLNQSYVISPNFRIVVQSPVSSAEYTVSVSNPVFVFYPQFTHHNSDNTLSYSYLIGFRPISMPDYRFLDALQHIWTAINGQSSASGSDLSSVLANQGQQNREGWDTSNSDVVKRDFSQSAGDYSQAEDDIFQMTGSLDNVNLDLELNNAENAVQFFKRSMNEVFNRVPLLKSFSVLVITFLVLAIILGVRRFF